MNLNLRFYWSLLLRRLPVMLALFLICSGVGIAVALSRPATYSAQARLSLTKPQIDASGARTGNSEQQQLQIIQQQLMTRPNLLDIARRFNVLEGQGDMSPDAIERNMRDSTSIRTLTGRNQTPIMILKFNARTGRLAADVTNEYVELIREYSARSTDDLVANRLDFWKQEVERLDQDIDLQSSRIVEFKNKNACCLPDDLSNRLARQATLRERLNTLARDEAALSQQKAEIIRQYETTGQVSNRNTPRTPEAQQLVQLKLQLTELLTIYSEESYRVRTARSQIEALEKIVAAQTDAATVTDTPSESSALDVAVAGVNSQLALLQQERDGISEELQRLDASIVSTSPNAIALNSLEREYQNLQGLYSSATKELSEAQRAQNVQVKDQGQKIYVYENASVPSEPSGPNRMALSAVGIGIGSALALGYFALLELLNRTIRRPAEIRSKFGIIPLATVPYLETQRQRFTRRALLLASSILVLIAVPTILWYIDQNYRPLDLLLTQVLRKVGLS